MERVRGDVPNQVLEAAFFNKQAMHSREAGFGNGRQSFFFFERKWENFDDPSWRKNASLAMWMETVANLDRIPQKRERQEIAGLNGVRFANWDNFYHNPLSTF